MERNMCSCCGKKFDAEVYSACPVCGCPDIYPDTREGVAVILHHKYFRKQQKQKRRIRYVPFYM